MNPSEWDEGYARTSDRPPHSGWAGFGPYEDKRAKIANRVVFWVSFAAVVVAYFYGG